MANITKKRASGILLHITSLPSKYGIGDLGNEARRFSDFLKTSKQHFWQVLPLTPPAPFKQSWSPYNCFSAFAGNTLLISPDLLLRDGLLTKNDLKNVPHFPDSFVDFPKAVRFKNKLLKKACQNFENGNNNKDFKKFCVQNKYWLDDFALFVALHKRFGHISWCDWPPKVKNRDKETIEQLENILQAEETGEKILQYLFFKQWFELKSCCNRSNIKIIGDIPIYVAHDSCDVWANPQIFKLTKSKRPQFLAGVPPDLFSKTGQLWGNPVYDWKVLKKTKYDWWIRRIRHNMNLFDIVRIDHFRGFFDYWQVPAANKTAAGGRWIKAPYKDFFKTLFKHINRSEIIAEDLGYITPKIRGFIKKSDIACMRVLQFGFGGDLSKNRHFPANLPQNCVLYSGTHDNNTIKGWFETQADELQKKRLFELTGGKATIKNLNWAFINLALSTRVRLVIIPMQDVLGLGTQARMNRPGTTKGNWLWRLTPQQISPQKSIKLKKITQLNNRT
jgi:4-alpha-glucanotransferase